MVSSSLSILGSNFNRGWWLSHHQARQTVLRGIGEAFRYSVVLPPPPPVSYEHINMSLEPGVGASEQILQELSASQRLTGDNVCNYKSGGTKMLISCR